MGQNLQEAINQRYEHDKKSDSMIKGSMPHK
jgi:hypothetical protein